jgi:hypothetical protein
MSSIGFRDSSVVIIETGRTLIRGGLGLHELLRTPAVVSLSPQSTPALFLELALIDMYNHPVHASAAH